MFVVFTPNRLIFPHQHLAAQKKGLTLEAHQIVKTDFNVAGQSKFIHLSILITNYIHKTFNYTVLCELKRTNV